MVFAVDISRKEAIIDNYYDRFRSNLVFGLSIYDIPSSDSWFSLLRLKGFKVLRTNSHFLAKVLEGRFGYSIGSSSVCVICRPSNNFYDYKEFYCGVSDVVSKSLEIGFDLVFLNVFGRVYNGVDGFRFLQYFKTRSYYWNILL